MSREIDERIVAMYFDNDQFEKGARQSMKTLDELKQGLDFEGVGESFQEVQKMTSKGFGLKNSTKQVGFFSKAISGMGKAAKTAFNVASMPIQALGNSFKAMEGYVGKVLGFNLASKLVNTGETIIRAFTIDPMRSGWNEYELKMDSIKTIMTGTAEQFKKDMGDAYSEETHLQAVKNALEELNHYADQTVYSFSDMTSNIGKFTNNGVKLNDAVMAMKGISNAAAAAGQGTQQASMAMYNLSQAISVGKLTTMDWKSIENANMATQQFKQTFIDMAVAMGKLERKGDQYYTKTNKHMEVTAENFRNTLAEGWADTDVITAALKVWSGDYNQLQLEAMGVPRELAMQLEELGKEAMEAATQVRTFTKMWDALKEAAQSGWSMSWELIFGDMNEATNMWSHFNERFSGWIENAANARNELLRGWRGEMTVADAANALREATEDWEEKYKFEDWMNSKEDGITSIASAILEDFKQNGGDVEHAMETLRREYKLTADDAKAAVMAISNAMEDGTLSYVGKDGRLDLMAGIDNLLEGFENIGRFFGKLKSAIFGDITPETLQSLTTGFRNVTAAFADWTKNLGNSSFLQNLQTGLKGLGSLLKPIWNTVKKLGDLALSFVGPVANFLSDIFAGFGEWVGTLKDSPIWQKFEGFYKSAKELIKVKVGGWFKKVGEDVKGFFTALGKKDQGWFDQKGLSGIGKFLIGFGENVSNAWTKLTGWSGWQTIGTFLSNAGTAIKNAWNSVFGEGGWAKPWIDKIGNFFTNTWASIKALFTPTAGADGNEQPSPVMTFLTGVWEKLKSAWESVFGESGTAKPWIDKIGNFFTNTWASIKAIFTPTKNEKGEEQPSPAMTFLTGVWEKLSGAWNTAFGEGSKGKEFIDKIGNFFTNTWASIKALFTPTKNEKGEEQPSPAMTFLTGVWEKLKSAWESVFGESGAAKPWIDKIGNFFTNTWATIKALFTPTAGADGNEQPSPVMTFLTGVWEKLKSAWESVFGESGTAKPWIDKIGNFFTNTWASIKSIFTPTKNEKGEEQPSPVMTFLTGVWEKLKSAWESVFGESGTAKPWIDKIGNFFENTWASIRELFKPTTTENGEPEGPSRVSSFLEEAHRTISSAWTSLWSFLETEGPKIGKFISDAFGFLVGLIVPSANAEADPVNVGEAVVQAIPEMTPEQVSEVSERLTLFEQFTNILSGFVEKVKGWNGWNEIGTVLRALLDGVTGLISAIVTPENIQTTKDLLIRTFELILDILDKATEFIGKLIAGDTSSWFLLFAGWLGKLSMNAVMPDVSPLNSFAMQILELSAAVALISGAIAVLGNMKIENLGKGILGLVVVIGALLIVLPKFKELTQARTALHEARSPNAGWEKVAGKFVKWVGIMGTLKIAMSELPEIIKAFGKSGVNPDKLFGVLSGLAVLIGGLSLVIGIVSKMNADPGSIIGVSTAIALAMPILAVGLYAVVATLGGLIALLDSLGSNDLIFEKLESFFTRLGGLWVTIKSAFTADPVTGGDLTLLGMGVNNASKSMEDVDEGQFEKLSNVMGIIKEIGDNLPKNPDLWQQWFGGGITFSELPETLKSLAQGGQNFAAVASEISDEDLTAADRLAEFFRKILVVANLTQLLNNLGADYATGNFLAFLDIISKPAEFGFNESMEKAVDNVSSFAQTINQSIIDAAPEVDVAPLIDAIANGISGADSKDILKNAFASLGTLLAGEGVELPTADVTGGGNLFSGLFSMLDTFNPGDYTSELNKMLGEFDPETLTNKLGIGDVFDMSGTGLSTQINEMMTAMQAQLDSGEYSLGVQMVPEWTNGDPPSWWGGDAPMSIKGEVSIVPTDLLHVTNMLNTIRNSIDVKGNEIVIAVNNLGSRINNLGDRIDGISGSIANMQLVLDTGVVAGAVDRRLGKQVAIESRAGGGGR